MKKKIEINNNILLFPNNKNNTLVFPTEALTFVLFNKKSSSINCYLTMIHLNPNIKFTFNDRLNIVLRRTHPDKTIQQQQQKIIEQEQKINDLSTFILKEIDKGSDANLKLIQNSFKDLKKISRISINWNPGVLTSKRQIKLANLPEIITSIEEVEVDITSTTTIKSAKFNIKKNEELGIYEIITKLRITHPRIAVDLAYEEYCLNCPKTMKQLMNVEPLIFEMQKIKWHRKDYSVEYLGMFENTQNIKGNKYYTFAIFLPYQKIDLTPLDYDTSSQIIPVNEQEKKYLAQYPEVNIDEMELDISLYRNMRTANPFDQNECANALVDASQYQKKPLIQQLIKEKFILTPKTSQRLYLDICSNETTKNIPLFYGQRLNNIELGIMLNESMLFLLNLEANDEKLVHYLSYDNSNITFFIPKQAFLWSYLHADKFNPYQLEISTPKTQEEISLKKSHKNYEESVEHLKETILGKDPSETDLVRFQNIANSVITQDKEEIERFYTYPELKLIALMMGRKIAAKALVCNIGLGAIVKKKILAHEAYTRENVGKHKYTKVYPGPLETIESFNQRMLTTIKNNKNDNLRVEIIDDIHVFEQKTDQIIQVYESKRLHNLLNMGNTITSVWENIG